MEPSATFRRMEQTISQLQEDICRELTRVDGKPFQPEPWERAGGGGGITRYIENGHVFEKGGVNIASVHGTLPEPVADTLGVAPGEFAACGLSIVLHPFSPRIPTVHLNIRYFEMDHGQSWFAGGIDLTPYYPHLEDFEHFHRTVFQACQKHLPGEYPRFKQQCDTYFTLPHRKEMRGIGGIFFDFLDGRKETHFLFTREVGHCFLPAYLPIVQRRKEEPFTARDKEFQLVRRGRYIEFNLIYDRGTAFGLKTGGRVESIFVSLPLEARFPYRWVSPPGSPYAQMEQYYQPRQWIDPTSGEPEKNR